MLRRRIIAAATATVLALGMSVGGAGAALANSGSDGPTPYTVDTTGVTLPSGDTFAAGDHVNIKTSVGDKGLHFENNGSPDAPKRKYIGASFIPWSALELTGSFCVTWVQVAGYNQHFGEGGQQPVCVEGGSTIPPAGNEKKVYVCKYVGTPGVDERLQTGQNPIEVSVNSIQNNTWDGTTVPAWFSDAQNRSYVLQYSEARGDGQRDEPTIADCPSPEVPPTPECVTVVWEMPSWAGDRTPTWPQTFYASYETECYNLDVFVPTECGTYWQVDSYLNNETTAALIAGGVLNGPNNPQESFPANPGWGKTYKLVKNDDCEPPVLNLTFMCKAVVDGAVTNLAYAGNTESWNAGDYIFRVTSNVAGVDFQVKKNDTVYFEGETIDGAVFFKLDDPVAGLTVFWDGGKKGTSSTNESACGFIPVETTADIDVTPADCLTGSALNEAGFDYTVGESTYAIANGENGTKVITFTAVLGFTFADGATTQQFTYTPTGPDLSKCGLTTASIAITPADCLTGSSLDEEGFLFDSDESSYVITDGENGQKVITFTAKPGFLFADQQTTKVFTFTPTGPDFRDCELATASLTVPDPTCDAGQDWSLASFAPVNASYEVTKQPTSENGYAFEVVFTADTGAKFLVGGEYVDTFTETGTLDPEPNRDLCEEITAQVGFTVPTCDTGAQLDPTLFTSTPADSATFTIGMSDILDSYVVTATAKPGFTFADGAQTQVFSGQLAGPDTSLCEEPTLEGSITTTACETDVPYILFSIELNDPDNQSTAGLEDAEIIFSGLDSEGNEREYVLGDLEGTVVDGVFSGKVLWPGAAVVDGQAAGWPGWALVDGEWTNVGDENFGWTRTLNSVTLSVNPTLKVELSYPPASPECATDPTVVDAFIEYSYDCLLGGTIELSDVDGVIWSIDGEQTDQRVWTGQDIEFAPVFTASLDPEQPGLFFSPESIAELTVEFELPESGCDLVTSPLVTPTLSSTQATCTTAGSYTLDAVEGVQWLVNGQVTAPGTYTATTGSTVEVEAVALQGFGFGFETQTEWTLSFPAPAAGACDLPTLSLEETDLPTLALTGASGMLGTVGIIALLITLTGIGAVVARRRVEA